MTKPATRPLNQSFGSCKTATWITRLLDAAIAARRMHTDASMSAPSISVSEQEMQRQMDTSSQSADLQSAEVGYDLQASMLYSDGWKVAPSRTRVYRQV